MVIAAKNGRGVHRGRDTRTVSNGAYWIGHLKARELASSCKERAAPASTTVGAVHQIDADDDVASVAHPLHRSLAKAIPTGREDSATANPTGRDKGCQLQSTVKLMCTRIEGGGTAVSTRGIW